MQDATPATLTEQNPWALAALELYESNGEVIEDLDSYSKAPNTIRGYCSDWHQFATWARSRGVDLPLCDGETLTLPAPVPAAVVKVYVADRQHELKAATMTRHLSALRHWHHENGWASPTDHPEVKRTLAGLARKHAYQPDRAKPLFLADLRTGLPEGDEPKAIRDRALLLVGWWAALRRSELVALRPRDLSDHPEGVVIGIGKSKTDQEGKGAQVALHYREEVEVDPVRALRGWVELGTDESQNLPVFRQVDRWGNVGARGISGQTVSLIVKDACRRVGLDPADYSAHSLRAGFVSECDRRHVPSAAVRAVTRHTTDAMLNVYERPAQLFADSAGAYFDD